MSIAWTTLDHGQGTDTTTTSTISLNVGTLASTDLLVALLGASDNDGNSNTLTVASSNNFTKVADCGSSPGAHAMVWQITGLTLSGSQTFVYTSPFTTFLGVSFLIGKLTGLTSTTATATGTNQTATSPIHFSTLFNVPNPGYGLVVFANSNASPGNFTNFTTLFDDTATGTGLFGISPLGPVTSWDPNITHSGTNGIAGAAWQGVAASPPPFATNGAPLIFI